MRFLVDECTGPSVADWLRDKGHEVYSVFDESRGGKSCKPIAESGRPVNLRAHELMN